MTDARTNSPLSQILARAWPRDAAALAALRDFASARMGLFLRQSEGCPTFEKCWAYARAAEWARREAEIEKELKLLPVQSAGASLIP